jgi:hypothetical protein
MTSKIEVDDGAQVTISLDGTKADVLAGGHGQDGDIVIEDAEGNERIRLGRVVETTALPGDVTPTPTADYTGIRVRDGTGAKIAELGQQQLPSQLSGGGPDPVALGLGGGGGRGQVMLEDGAGAVTVRIDAEKGARIKAESAADPAGRFEIANKKNNHPALYASTQGSGDAVYASSASGNGVQGHAAGGYVQGVCGTAVSSVSLGVSGRHEGLGSQGALGTSHYQPEDITAVHFPVGAAGSARGLDSHGVWGAADHVGVLGVGSSELVSRKVKGLTEPLGIGVWAQGNRLGLLAIADGPEAGAGGFMGDVDVTGDLSVSGTKLFRIDHPLDPEAKYLLHACVESAERLNVYSGTVRLDGEGQASVELPDWFTALNGDVRYQLTPIGAPAPSLHVSEEIDDSGRFGIAGGPPRTKVSWQVSGVRQDAHARANPFEVEVAKPEAVSGKLVHPSAHGFSEERGIDYKAREVAHRIRSSRCVAFAPQSAE